MKRAATLPDTPSSAKRAGRAMMTPPPSSSRVLFFFAALLLFVMCAPNSAAFSTHSNSKCCRRADKKPRISSRRSLVELKRHPKPRRSIRLQSETNEEPARSSDFENDYYETAAEEGMDLVFNALDLDGSGSIDQDEFHQHLAPAGYSKDAIRNSFSEMDRDQSGEISRDEFRKAILLKASEEDDDDATIIQDCPRGYFLNSVRQSCVALGPIGRISQRVETLGPFEKAYRKISNLFGVDTKKISKLGVSFALAYSIISNLNGAISFSVAWYISCKRVSTRVLQLFSCGILPFVISTHGIMKLTFYHLHNL